MSSRLAPARADYVAALLKPSWLVPTAAGFVVFNGLAWLVWHGLFGGPDWFPAGAAGLWVGMGLHGGAEHNARRRRVSER